MHFMDWVAVAAGLSGTSAIVTLFQLHYMDNDKLPVIARALMAATVCVFLMGVVTFGNDIRNGLNNVGKNIGGISVPSDTTMPDSGDPCDLASASYDSNASC